MWAGDCGELHFGDNVVSARHQSRYSTATTCLFTYEKLCCRPGLNEVKTNMDLFFTTSASEGLKGGQNDRISDLLLAARLCIHKGSC